MQARLLWVTGLFATLNVGLSKKKGIKLWQICDCISLTLMNAQADMDLASREVNRLQLPGNIRQGYCVRQAVQQDRAYKWGPYSYQWKVSALHLKCSEWKHYSSVCSEGSLEGKMVPLYLTLAKPLQTLWCHWNCGSQLSLWSQTFSTAYHASVGL